MKIIGRILMILTAFTALSMLMTLAVNAGGISSSAPDFDDVPPQFQSRQGSREGFGPEGGEFRPERGERKEQGGAGWVFGLTKNIGVIALVAALIILPKRFSQRKKAAVNAANG
jgi:hypothetical protein